MNSEAFDGPLAVLAGGSRIVRAGTGRAAIWDLETLPTHGPEGKDMIGGQFDVEDSWRCDPECIEPSGGAEETTTIQFEDKLLKPSIWRSHPGGSEGAMLCALDCNVLEQANYSVVALDLEHGGKVMSRHLGHGAKINEMSTSSGDPYMFATMCDGGFARVWDVRQPLPTLTCDVGFTEDALCGGLALAHPGGIPSTFLFLYIFRVSTFEFLLILHPLALFTGANKQEEIRLWDLRARSVVYELGTGNNSATSLAWDGERNALYAATHCYYTEATRRNYRKAEIPRNPEEDRDRYWPKDAYHDEHYFGSPFNAGKNLICEWQP